MRARLSVAVLPLLLPLMAAGAAVQASQDLGAAGVTVPVQLLERESLVLLGGTVVPARQVTIAAQLPGRVEFIAGEEGDVFDRNTLLVALDDDELLAKRQAALAQMGNADAALRNAGVQFNRELISPSSRNTMSGMGVPGMFDQFFTRNFSDMMGINDSGMDRHADLYARSTGVEQARSAFLQARSQVMAIDARLRDTVGYAPFDGVIVEKMVEPGDTVQPGQPLLAYADTAALQLKVEVPARLMPGVVPNSLVPATLDVHNAQVMARVSQIFPMADPVRHTVTVKLDLPKDAPAAPGMYAEVEIPDINLPATQLPVIPRSAVIQRGSLPTVCIRNASGKKEMRVIRTGEAIADGRIAVLAGLGGNEQVFVNPEPGMRCR